MNWRKDVEKFRSELKIVPSSFSKNAVVISFFGHVASGKSVTAGICAVAITPEGPIGWVDGESGRSGYAADIVASMAAKQYGKPKQAFLERFKVIHIDPPFHPLRVVAAMELLEEQGCKTIILDILTQTWDSDGGYLDLKEQEIDRMAGDQDWKRDKVAMAAAAHVKPWTHTKLCKYVETRKCNLILCFQAKQRARIGKDEKGKTEIGVDDFETPIQESNLTRTALVVGKVECRMTGEGANAVPEGGYCTFRGSIKEGVKYTHPDLLKILPRNGEQFHFSHGEALAAWCSGTPTAKPATDPVKEAIKYMDNSAALKKLKSQLWKMTVEHHMEVPAKLEQYLHDELFIQDDESLATLTEKRLSAVIEAINHKLEAK